MNRILRVCLSTLSVIALAFGLAGCGSSRSRENPVGPTKDRPKAADVGPGWEQNVRIRSALDQGDAPRAERLARSIVDRQPANAEAHFLLGKSLLSQKKLVPARQYLEKATVLQPENSLYRRTLAENLDQGAQEALQKDDPKQAINFWKRCITFKYKPKQTEKNLAGAYRQLGEVLRNEKKDSEAEAAFRDAISIMPDNPLPRLDLANLLSETDRLLEAERVLKELIDLKPSFEPGRIAYARLLYRMGDIRGSKAWTEKILSMSPENPEAIALKAELEGEVPMTPSAVSAPAASDLDADPDIVQKLTILESSSNFKGQAEILEEYLIAHPSASWAQLRLGMVLERSGDITGALSAVNRYLQGQPEDSRAQFFKARCLQLSGDLEGALAILTILDAENKSNIQVYDELGQVYAKMGQFEKAKTYWSKALKTDPDYASVLFSFGQLAMEQKNTTEAKSYFDRAVQKEPFNLKFRYFAGLNLKQAGLDSEALAVWKSAKVNLNPSDLYGARILRALGEPVPVAPPISNLTAHPPALLMSGEPTIQPTPVATAQRKSATPDVPDVPNATGMPVAPVTPDIPVAQAGPVTLNTPDRPVTSVTLSSQTGASPVAPPADGDLAYTAALDAARGGRFPEAIAGFETVLQNDPANFNALINLGKVYSAQGNHAQASLQYQRALLAAPENQHAMKALIRSYSDLGLHRQAAELTKSAIEKFPSMAADFPEMKAGSSLPKSNPRAYEPFIRLLLQDHHPEEAQKIIRAGIEENPDNPKLLVLEGEVLYCLNQLDQAEATLRRAIEMDNANPLPFLKLGDLYAARKDFDQAFAQYQLAQKAKFLDPDTAFEIVDRLIAIGKSTEGNLLLSRIKGMNLSESQVAKLRDRKGTP